MALFAAQDAYEAAHGVSLPVGRFHDFVERGPFARCIMAITSAFLFVRSEFRLPAAFLAGCDLSFGLAHPTCKPDSWEPV
jgi:hypothetical protein